MRNKLDTFANVAIILLCVVGSAAFAKRYLIAEPPAEDPPPIVAAGDRLPAEALNGINAAGEALLLSLHPDCGFCTQSLPFYRRLQEKIGQGHSGLAFHAVVAEEELLEPESKALAAAGFRPDSLRVGDFPALGLIGTPILLRVDAGGEVLDVWPGKVDEERLEEISQRLGLDG